MQTPTKYNLSPDIILRAEPQYYRSYSAFNYKTVQSQTLTHEEMKVLHYIQTHSASIEEIAAASGLKRKALEKFLKELQKQEFVQVNQQPPSSRAPSPVNPEAYRSFPIPFLSAPSQVDFFITSRCNLHCVHCFAEVKTRQATDYPLKELEAAFRMLEQVAVLEVRVSGGEPLLHGDVFGVLELLGKSRFRKVMLTNGTLLTEALVLALKAAGVTPTVSLDDSDAETHDSFRGVEDAHRRTLEGMKLLQRFGVEYGINCCLNKKNLTRIDAIIDLASEYGASRIAFLDLKPIGRMRGNTEWLPTNSEYEAALKKLFIARAKNRKIEVSVDAYLHCYPMRESVALAEKGVVSCRAGISRLSIGHDGTVYPCNLVVGDPRWAMGNLKEVSLEKIWFTQKWLFFRGKTKTVDLKDCKDCKSRGGCLDFYCRLLPYAATGDLYGTQLKCRH
jgi:radical SAM protein with 4Fe4S-binding SPASM domain